MRKNVTRKIQIATALTIAALAVSGCTPEDATPETVPLEQDLTVNSLIGWDGSTAKALEEDGWTVMDIQAEAKADGVDYPEAYSATKGDCSINWNFSYPQAKYENQSQMLLTQNAIYEQAGQSAVVTDVKPITVKLTDNEKTMEFMTGNFVQESIPVPGGFTNPDGTENTGGKTAASKGSMLIRIFDESTEDFGAVEGFIFHQGASLSYTCYEDDVDPEVWETVVNNAELKIDFTVKE